ncbi:MAG: hypothetical protein M1813_006605 [Trichoglossum hirsutum]|nr:MAG: hypothetical protein M1813_006605 [Trichoglossum hirsutum]
MATITSHISPTNTAYPVDTDFIGVTPLFESDDTDVDIIAVPGLGSHAMGAFKAKGGNNIWLRDFLPKDIPTARILVYGYDTTITEKDVKHSITDLAIAFLDSIRAFRAATKTSRRPIVFIGHSLGGLLIKQALSLALRGKGDQRNSDFFKSSYGLVFFGVPNLGLKVGKLKDITSGQLNSNLIYDLSVDDESEPSAFLRNLTQEFIHSCQKQDPPFEIVSYYEQKKSHTAEKMSDGSLSMSGPPCFMVSRESACRIGHTDNFTQQLPLNTDHSGLVKFSCRSDDGYVRVMDNIKVLVDSAPLVVKRRFSLEVDLINNIHLILRFNKYSLTDHPLPKEEKYHRNDLDVPDYASTGKHRMSPSLCEFDIDRLADILLDKMSDKFCGACGTGCLVRAAKPTPQIFEEPLNHAKTKSMGVTEQADKAVVGNHGNRDELVMLLLEKCSEEVNITEEVLKALVGNHGNSDELVLLLLEKCSEEVDITGEVSKAVLEAVLKYMGQWEGSDDDAAI